VTPENDPSQIVAGIPNAELEQFLARKELAVTATGYISDVLEVDVTVGALLTLSQDIEPSDVRLAAKRALRCIEAIGREGSPVVRAVGEAGLYDYVECVVTYGASEKRYLELMEEERLTAEETTAIYALRQSIAEETDGNTPAFPAMRRALAEIGMSLKDAADDPDGALAKLEESGYFLNYVGGRTFDHPVFSPGLAALRVPLGRNIDTPRGNEAEQYVRTVTEGMRDEAEE